MKSEQYRYYQTNRIFYDGGDVKASVPRMIDLDMVVGYEAFYDESLRVVRPYTLVHFLHSYFLDPMVLIDVDYNDFKKAYDNYRKALADEVGLINRSSSDN